MSPLKISRMRADDAHSNSGMSPTTAWCNRVIVGKGISLAEEAHRDAPPVRDAAIVGLDGAGE